MRIALKRQDTPDLLHRIEDLENKQDDLVAAIALLSGKIRTGRYRKSLFKRLFRL